MFRFGVFLTFKNEGDLLKIETTLERNFDLPTPIHVSGRKSVQVLRVVRIFSPRCCANLS